MAASIYWHDYETWGADPRRDRASQFAGIRTDPELNEIGDPLMIYCQPSADRLPHPKACIVTGITPQYARTHGLPEADFVRRIHEQFSKPETCVAGYNNIRFDDELSRQLFYRNFYDPYEREWKHGNSRWDIIDMVRLCYAVRPGGLQWPRLDDGSPVFKLELLSQSNDLQHADAHDALSDVRATIALAKKIKQAQPKLYDFVFALRSKNHVNTLIDLHTQKPLLHVSAIYPAKNACSALVIPLAAHPLEANGVLLFDLGKDPAPWLDMSTAQLQERLFVAQQDLPEGESRLPVTVLHTNRCPVIAPLTVLDNGQKQHASLNLEQARRHWHLLRDSRHFVPALLQAYRNKAATAADSGESPPQDPDQMLYTGGFFSDADKRVMAQVRKMSPGEISAGFDLLCSQFRDSRLPEMLFRYRARNFYSSLSANEQVRWKQYCVSQCLHENNNNPQMTINRFAPLNFATVRLAINEERSLSSDSRDHQILHQLEQWLLELQRWAASES